MLCTFQVYHDVCVWGFGSLLSKELKKKLAVIPENYGLIGGQHTNIRMCTRTHTPLTTYLCCEISPVGLGAFSVTCGSVTDFRLPSSKGNSRVVESLHQWG